MDDYHQARKAIEAIKENIRKDRVWLLRRWTGWRPNEHFPGVREAIYETVPTYRLMTHEEMLNAQGEISKKYPGQLFEGYRVIPEGRVKPE
ncbi:hypothetical protein [Noviherbaspirillum sp.]|uniref:hypothetical protein n=1 Tax=Noviherbaspirillum sp. TaxID=1926288 RepID=UPI002FDFE55A